jgi:hypothetical protein
MKRFMTSVKCSLHIFILWNILKCSNDISWICDVGDEYHWWLFWWLFSTRFLAHIKVVRKITLSLGPKPFFPFEIFVSPLWGVDPSYNKSPNMTKHFQFFFSKFVEFFSENNNSMTKNFFLIWILFILVEFYTQKKCWLLEYFILYCPIFHVYGWGCGDN